MLIAISGPMGSGKDAIAAHLRERYGFAKVTFADGLREELLARMPRMLKLLHDAEKRRDYWAGECNAPDACICWSKGYDACLRRMLYDTKPDVFRALLQEYGSDVRRADDPDYWVKRWAERVSSIEAGRPVGMTHVVTPDCRFPNEARAVRAMGGLLWRVERPGHVGTGHVSETALAQWQDWDAEIQNAGTLADLHAEVDRLIHATADAQADGAA